MFSKHTTYLYMDCSCCILISEVRKLNGNWDNETCQLIFKFRKSQLEVHVHVHVCYMYRYPNHLPCPVFHLSQGTEVKAITFSNMQIHDHQNKHEVYVIVDI